MIVWSLGRCHDIVSLAERLRRFSDCEESSKRCWEIWRTCTTWESTLKRVAATHPVTPSTFEALTAFDMPAPADCFVDSSSVNRISRIIQMFAKKRLCSWLRRVSEARNLAQPPHTMTPGSVSASYRLLPDRGTSALEYQHLIIRLTIVLRPASKC